MGNAVVGLSMMSVDMAKEMQFGIDLRNSLKQFFGAIVDSVIEVKDSVRWSVGDKYIHIFRNIGIVAELTVADAVGHEHGHSIEFHPINGNAGVAEIMDVLVEPVDIGAIETIVMVSTDEYLVLIRKIAEPVEKIKSLLFRAYHAEVS